jgi:guanylate kinase
MKHFFNWFSFSFLLRPSGQKFAYFIHKADIAFVIGGDYAVTNGYQGRFQQFFFIGKNWSGEAHGQHYFFLTEEEFDCRVAAQDFLEWADFCGHRYGTPRSFVQERREAGYHVVLDIDVQGALKVRQAMPEAVLVFMMPPSWEELEARILARGTDTEDKIRRRLATAHREILAVPNYDYLVWNEDVSQAAQELQGILTAEMCRVTRLDRHEWERSFAGNPDALHNS